MTKLPIRRCSIDCCPSSAHRYACSVLFTGGEWSCVIASLNGMPIKMGDDFFFRNGANQLVLIGFKTKTLLPPEWATKKEIASKISINKMAWRRRKNLRSRVKCGGLRVALFECGRGRSAVPRRVTTDEREMAQRSKALCPCSHPFDLFITRLDAANERARRTSFVASLHVSDC